MKPTNTIKGLGLTALMLTAVFIGGATSAFAATDTNKQDRQEMRQEGRQGERPDFRQELSEDQLETLKEARELDESGDVEGAKTLLEDAGIKMPMKQMNEGDKETQENHEAVRAAMEAGDYEAFQLATADAPVDVKITQEQFEGMIDVKKLKDTGDFETARELAEELGLPQMRKGPAKKFVNNLTDDQKEIMQDAHDLMKDGDLDSAKELLEEAGIEMPEKEGFFKRLFGKKDK